MLHEVAQGGVARLSRVGLQKWVQFSLIFGTLETP